MTAFESSTGNQVRQSSADFLGSPEKKEAVAICSGATGELRLFKFIGLNLQTVPQSQGATALVSVLRI